MKESTLWNYIKAGMTGRWLATRIESSSGNGVPDVAFSMPNINGFMELKYIPEWPKRPETKVKLPLRPEQKLWISTRGKMGGNVWVLVRICNTFFLLDWKQSVEACEGFTAQEWVENTTYWHNKINFSELQTDLKEGYNGQMS